VILTVLKQFQEYVEPDEGLSSTVLAGLATPSQSRRPTSQSASASDGDGAMSSLGDNTLTSNLGIPIIVVLTKVCESVM
jgi:Dynein light intermediate chain (DLIC)